MYFESLDEIVSESHDVPLIVLFVLNVKSPTNEVHTQRHRVLNEKSRLLLEDCLGTSKYERLHVASLDVNQIICLGARAN